MARDSSKRRVSAGFADRTCTTGFLAREVAFDPVGFLDPPQWHLAPLKTSEAVPLRIILEMADVVFAIRLMLAVQHRNVWRDIPLEQPCQKRACAV